MSVNISNLFRVVSRHMKTLSRTNNHFGTSFLTIAPPSQPMILLKVIKIQNLIHARKICQPSADMYSRPLELRNRNPNSSLLWPLSFWTKN